MKCKQCRLVEMVAEKIEGNCIIHKCRKCGSEYKEEIKGEEE